MPVCLFTLKYIVSIALRSHQPDSNPTCFSRKVWPEGMQNCVFAFSDRSEDEIPSTSDDEWQEKWPAAAAIGNMWEGNKIMNALLFLSVCP